MNNQVQSKSLSPEFQFENVKFFIGQDLGAVGGFDDHNTGYVDFFGVPAGVTAYTSLQYLEGFNSRVNFGAGDVETDLYLTNDKFDGVDIAIGLYLVDQLKMINRGELDGQIDKLADWIASSGRQVYLRVGYEFEGEWNGYKAKPYREAFQRIVTRIREKDVTNVYFVWQSSGYEEKRAQLLDYYPGDEYVDWMAYSYFNHKPEEAGKEMLRLAREKGKPVMIAELTPRGYDLMLDDGAEVWKEWFVPFFEHLDNNGDVIKAIAYINARWEDQPMWKGQGWGDTRLQANMAIAGKWRRAVKRLGWEHGDLVTPPPIFILPDNYDELKAARDKVAQEAEVDGDQWQAEAAVATGNVRVYPDSAAAGGQGMAYIYQAGDSLTFEGAPNANVMIVRYASERSGKIGVFVNGNRQTDLEFEASGSWVGKYRKKQLRVEVNQNDSVAIVWEEGDTALNIDYVMFDRR